MKTNRLRQLLQEAEQIKRLQAIKEEKKEPCEPIENVENYTIAQHLEKVAQLSKESKLKSENIEKCKIHLTPLQEKLSMSEMQVMLLSVILENCNKKSIKKSDLSSHFECSYLTLLGYNDDIAVLRDRGYISLGREEHIFLNKDAIDSLLDNRAYEPENNSGLTISELFNRISRCFRKCIDEQITTTEVNRELGGLMRNNSQLHFVKYVVENLGEYKVEDSQYTHLLFIFLCHSLVNKGDVKVDSYDIRNIFDDKFQFDVLFAQLTREQHKLQTKKWIKTSVQQGFFSTCSTFSLAKSVIDEVLGGLVSDTCIKKYENDTDIIKADSLAAKPLFYNSEEGRQIEQLSSLLENENFQSVQQRLTQSGMRKGFAALLYGAPGTGKTESVYQIAKSTGRDIVMVDVSKIKSCWVGESEKNIKAAFDNYRELSAESERTPILLFNEADAVLGVRMSGAERSADKMSNSIQNIILQEMETLDGIMIATTNLTQNLDKAFERRFIYKIEFHKPSQEVKSSIWQAMIPTLEQEQASYLARKFDFSGAQIENIARKRTVEEIISGNSASIEAIEAYCKEELLDKRNSKRIGY